MGSRGFSGSPFDAQGPRYFRVIPADNAAPNELQAAINGTVAGASNFTSVVNSADALYGTLASDRQPYFNDLFRQPAHFMFHCNLFLQGLSQAEAKTLNGNAAVHPWLAQAQTASAAMSEALNNMTQSPVFAGWYGAESKFNVNNLRNLLNSVIGQYPAAQPYFQTARATSTQSIFAGSGGLSNGGYSILASTNLTVAPATWSIWATNVFDSSGNFSFTNRTVAGFSGDASGQWTLCIIDTDAFGDTGVLNTWSVHN